MDGEEKGERSRESEGKWRDSRRDGEGKSRKVFMSSNGSQILSPGEILRRSSLIGMIDIFFYSSEEERS